MKVTINKCENYPYLGFASWGPDSTTDFAVVLFTHTNVGTVLKSTHEGLSTGSSALIEESDYERFFGSVTISN